MSDYSMQNKKYAQIAHTICSISERGSPHICKQFTIAAHDLPFDNP